MYGKTVRLSDETLNVLENYRIFLCEKLEAEENYFVQKMVEQMSISDLIFYALDTSIKFDMK